MSMVARLVNTLRNRGQFPENPQMAAGKAHSKFTDCKLTTFPAHWACHRNARLTGVKDKNFMIFFSVFTWLQSTKTVVKHDKQTNKIQLHCWCQNISGSRFAFSDECKSFHQFQPSGISVLCIANTSSQHRVLDFHQVLQLGNCLMPKRLLINTWK